MALCSLSTGRISPPPRCGRGREELAGHDHRFFVGQRDRLARPRARRSAGSRPSLPTIAGEDDIDFRVAGDLVEGQRRGQRHRCGRVERSGWRSRQGGLELGDLLDEQLDVLAGSEAVTWKRSG